ncbi:unnamed protein product [Malus baccata var. baccata]
MDVKTAFLNGDLEEDIYMKQPEGFEVKGREKLVCKLKKSIYGLKQASSFILLVLYVDDILLATNDTSLLDETKTLLQQNFKMKDLGEASYVLGIEIKRDRKRGLLGLSQKGYIEKVLKRFNMFSCGTTEMPISKGDKLSKAQCPKNDLERKIMEEKPYASLVGSLMYAQVFAASTMVAEYLSCCEAVDQAIWLKNFIAGLRVVDLIARPIQLFCDNNAAIFFTKNNKRSSATKYQGRGVSTRNLDIKYLIAREKVMAGLVKIDYLETGSMIADPLNKAVPVMVFKKHIAKMGVLSGFDAVV